LFKSSLFRRYGVRGVTAASRHRYGAPRATMTHARTASGQRACLYEMVNLADALRGAGLRERPRAADKGTVWEWAGSGPGEPAA
jgi:hypothetical protein